MKRASCLLSLVALLLCSGCASIVSKSQYPVSINSSPAGATVSVKDSHGVEVFRGTTPTVVTLKASTGYFSPASYSLQFEKEGYAPGAASISAGMDGWYIGNIIFGGLIGMLVVDPLTGAMWRLDDAVYANLPPNPGSLPATYTGPSLETSIPVTAVSPSSDGIAQQLKQLKELKDSGILTEEEYEAKRKALVDKL